VGSLNTYAWDNNVVNRSNLGTIDKFWHEIMAGRLNSSIVMRDTEIKHDINTILLDNILEFLSEIPFHNTINCCTITKKTYKTINFSEN
jgi:hypothetical protein